MKRTDSDGATINNLFTNGNPSLGIPSTTVDDNWLNTMQEEIALFCEANGITLDQTGVDVTQFQQALNNFTGGGGVGVADVVIGNNEVAPLDVTGLLFDKIVTKSARILFDLTRNTATVDYLEVGEFFAVYDPIADDWRLSVDSNFDDAGVTFSITAAGQIQFTSDSLAGGSYSGNLKLKNIVKIAI